MRSQTTAPHWSYSRKCRPRSTDGALRNRDREMQAAVRLTLPLPKRSRRTSSSNSRGTAFNEAEGTMVDMMMLLVLAVWVLLPLAPAILMFRLVPGNAITLTGPLANLTLNASGAIAAYFGVFVFISF